MDVKKMCLDYADHELEQSLLQGNDPDVENQNGGVVKPRLKFKFVDGVQRLADLPLPF